MDHHESVDLAVASCELDLARFLLPCGNLSHWKVRPPSNPTGVCGISGRSWLPLEYVHIIHESGVNAGYVASMRSYLNRLPYSEYDYLGAVNEWTGMGFGCSTNLYGIERMHLYEVVHDIVMNSVQWLGSCWRRKILTCHTRLSTDRRVALRHRPQTSILPRVQSKEDSTIIIAL